MGQKKATDSLAAVFSAFLVKRTWRQAELARHVGIGVPALKKHLDSLHDSGVPLVSDDDPPNVFWSVPKTWFPGGVYFATDDIPTLVRLLSRLPKTKDRDRLLRVILAALPRAEVPSVVPKAASEPEEKYLSAVEDSSTRKKPLRFRYFTASRGSSSLRHASVHRVFAGPPARFLATCHRTGDLKWFRVDNVSDAGVDEHGEFRPASDAAIDVVIRGSLNGYQGTAKLEKHAFFVKDPDAKGVVGNLLDGMHVEEEPGGVRISIETTALTRLARYVVGLGDAVKVISPSLKEACTGLAKGYLAENA